MDTSKYFWPALTEANNKHIARIKVVAAAVDAKALNTPSKEPLRGTKIDYAKELNPRQLAAVTTIDGPSLVIAGAGSGKTRTAIYRVAYLIEAGINPENILALSFTRKAAEEMTERIAKLLSRDNAKKVTSSTFHSFAIRTLKEYQGFSGVSSKYIIIDPTDSQDLIDYVINGLEWDPKLVKLLKPDLLFTIISKARNWNVKIPDMVAKEFPEFAKHLDKIVKVADLYRDEKSKASKLDFDDVLILFKNLLRKSDDFRNAIQERYKYIMVDEYQDTNVVQKDILDQMAAKYNNIMVVGDDWQSIYRFRGATMENILTFQESYPNCAVIKLEHNYRSTQSILDFTNPVMDNCVLGYKKKLFSTNGKGSKPELRAFASKEHESLYIASEIVTLKANGKLLDDMAVIFRSAYHSRQLQVELERKRINYVVYGGIKFSERKHVKDMISIMRLMNNHNDIIAWHRILRLLPGVGAITANKIAAVASSQPQLSFDDFKDSKFYSELEGLHLLLRQSSATSDVGDLAAKTRNYCANFFDDSEDYRLSDLDLLCNIAFEYRSLDRFLNDFSIDPPSKKAANSETPITDQAERELKPLVLTTVHSAKGLEWDTVFVMHCLDGLFPSNKGLSDIEDIEEERRLFYVACTRAKTRLCLTMPNNARTFKGDTLDKPSRFIACTPPSTYQAVNVSAAPSKRW